MPSSHERPGDSPCMPLLGAPSLMWHGDRGWSVERALQGRGLLPCAQMRRMPQEAHLFHNAGMQRIGGVLASRGHGYGCRERAAEALRVALHDIAAPQHEVTDPARHSGTANPQHVYMQPPQVSTQHGMPGIVRNHCDI